MDKPRVTGKMIAEMLGVSPTAVSLVRKGKDGVSPEKRRQILELMEKMGYSDLSEIHRRKTAILFYRNDLYELKQIFYHELWNEILKQGVSDYDFFVVASDYENIGDEPMRSPSGKPWDIAIILGDPQDTILYQLFQNRIPYIVVDSSTQSKLSSAVCVDYEAASYTMTKYLMKRGHSRIAYIGNARSGEDHSFTVKTFSGYQRAMMEKGISGESNFICMNASEESSLIEFLDKTMQNRQRPTALLCTTDCNAILAIRHLYRLGYRVPQDVSVVGMDDLSVSKYITPPLTTIHVDRAEMAQCTLELMDKLLHGKTVKSIYVKKCVLQERESVCEPKIE